MNSESFLSEVKQIIENENIERLDKIYTLYINQNNNTSCPHRVYYHSFILLMFQLSADINSLNKKDFNKWMRFFNNDNDYINVFYEIINLVSTTLTNNDILLLFRTIDNLIYKEGFLYNVIKDIDNIPPNTLTNIPPSTLTNEYISSLVLFPVKLSNKIINNKKYAKKLCDKNYYKFLCVAINKYIFSNNSTSYFILNLINRLCIHYNSFWIYYFNELFKGNNPPTSQDNIIPLSNIPKPYNLSTKTKSLFYCTLASYYISSNISQYELRNIAANIFNNIIELNDIFLSSLCLIPPIENRDIYKELFLILDVIIASYHDSKDIVILLTQVAKIFGTKKILSFSSSIYTKSITHILLRCLQTFLDKNNNNFTMCPLNNNIIADIATGIQIRLDYGNSYNEGCKYNTCLYDATAIAYYFSIIVKSTHADDEPLDLLKDDNMLSDNNEFIEYKNNYCIDDWFNRENIKKSFDLINNITNNNTQNTKNTNILITPLTDSDYDSDDLNFRPYDMPDLKAKNTSYLRAILNTLSKGDNSIDIKNINNTIRNYPDDLQLLSIPLSSALLNYDKDRKDVLQALQSILVTALSSRTTKDSNILVKQEPYHQIIYHYINNIFYSNNVTVSDKIDILLVIGKSAIELDSMNENNIEGSKYNNKLIVDLSDGENSKYESWQFDDIEKQNKILKNTRYFARSKDIKLYVSKFGSLCVHFFFPLIKFFSIDTSSTSESNKWYSEDIKNTEGGSDIFTLFNSFPTLHATYNFTLADIIACSSSATSTDIARMTGCLLEYMLLNINICSAYPQVRKSSIYSLFKLFSMLSNSKTEFLLLDYKVQLQASVTILTAAIDSDLELEVRKLAVSTLSCINNILNDLTG